MASEAIDLQSGLVPKTAAPTPSAPPTTPGPQQPAAPAAAPQQAQSAGVDLSSGLVAKDPAQDSQAEKPEKPVHMEGLMRFLYGDDFVDKVKRGEMSDAEAKLHVSLSPYKGMLKGVGETVHTAGDLINKIPGVGETLAPRQGLDALDQMTTSHGAVEGTGKTVEAIGEFMLGDETLKGLSYADKLKQLAPVVKIFEKYPRLAQTLLTGIRSGTVATGQSLAHGSDVKDAAINGAITAGTGAATEGVVQGGKAIFDKIRPGTTTIAGETMPELASQRSGHAPLAEKAATIENSPAIAEAQQKGTQQAVKNIARNAAEKSVTRVNETRVPKTEEVPITKPSAFANGKRDTNHFKNALTELFGDREFGSLTPQEQSKVALRAEELKRGATPSTPSIGQGLATRSESAQIGTTAQTVPESVMPKNKLTEEIGSTAATIPKQVLEPKAAPEARTITVDREVPAKFDKATTDTSKIHTFADAADHVENSAKPVYQKLDEVSGGKFTALREQRKAALQVLRDPASIDAWEKAQQKLSEAESGMDELFKTHAKDVGPEDLKAANSAWKDAKTLDKIHTAVERSFNGVPENIAERTGVKRILKGDPLRRSLGSLLEKSGQGEIERVIGKEGVDNLYRIADLTKTPQSTAATQEVAKNVGKYILHRYGTGGVIGGAVGSLVGHTATGALAGASAQDATMRVLHEAATNPRVGKMIADAVKVGASPKVYSALISSALVGKDQDAKKEGKTGEQ